MKRRINWQEIFVHDVEVAAFVIVSLMLFASVTSYAFTEMGADKKIKTNSYSLLRNPVSVELRDANQDGINDLILTHQNGQREIVITRQIGQ